jgi:hypothetical protein
MATPDVVPSKDRPCIEWVRMAMDRTPQSLLRRRQRGAGLTSTRVNRLEPVIGS